MSKQLHLSILMLTLFFCQNGYTQQHKDSTRSRVVFSGSLGITNNGFSIIPSFSFNEPASVILLSWKKKKLSIDPEFRITPTGGKGSIILWFRYHAIQGKRFTFRVGGHPAVNWFPSTVLQNGVSEDFLRLRRFLAWELAPSYRISKNWSTSLYYLQGNGMQVNGPRTTHFINLNTTISNIPVSNTLQLTVTPALYYLFLDGNDGIFFTANASLGNSKSPFLLQEAINQKIQSTISGTNTFMWNVGLAYTFTKQLAPVNSNR